jgi:Domain of unknown function (DUF5664)
MSARKDDKGKPALELIPGDALEEVARALMFGAGRYGRDNWLKGMLWGRLFGAALRHVYKPLRGQWLDEESGLPHLAHACCCLLFLLTYDRRKLGTDDVTGRAEETVPSGQNKTTSVGSLEPAMSHPPACDCIFCQTLTPYYRVRAAQQCRDPGVLIPAKGGNDVPT